MELLLDMVWWHWMVLGLFLTALELVAPGSFFIIFFGVAALLVGLLDLWGLAGPVWVQWLLFAIISVAALAPLPQSPAAPGAGQISRMRRSSTR